MKYWVTKDGTEIEISKLGDWHLLNIKKFIEKRATEGVWIGGGQYWEEGDSDFWEDVLYGEEARELLGYKDIIKEIKKRKLTQQMLDN